jgi:hypothetical protein
MTETRIDSESLARMGTALDEAYGTLPAGQQTSERKSPSQGQSLYLASQGELDPARLSSRAFGLIATGDRLDFEVLTDDTIATVRSIIDVELAKAHAQGCRIRTP